MPRYLQRYHLLPLMIAILILAVVSLSACQQAESGKVSNGLAAASATAPVPSTAVASPMTTATLPSPTEQSQQSTRAPAGPYLSITILHTNDVDGNVDPCG